MAADPTLDGLWQFAGLHPDWSEEEGGEEGWEALVNWWAVSSPRGLVLIDPLPGDWDELDQLVESRAGCAGIIRTCHWHQRSIAEAAERYGAEVWAKQPEEALALSPDHPVAEGEVIFDAIRVYSMERTDEIALWLPEQAALVFGDAMLRRSSGELRVCPESWLQPDGGPARLRALLARLAELPAEHVLVGHGPLLLGDGASGLRAALG